MANTSYFQNVVIQLDTNGNVVSCQINVAYKDSVNTSLQGGLSPFIAPTDPSLQSIAIEAQKLITNLKTANGVS
jgi:hypothetical protein